MIVRAIITEPFSVFKEGIPTRTTITNQLKR